MKCPQCGNEEDKKIAGYEVRGVYDGVLFWLCIACDTAFPRDFGYFARRNQQSKEYAENYNKEKS